LRISSPQQLLTNDDQYFRRAARILSGRRSTDRIEPDEGLSAR
jgi:hypothetical protein